MTSRTLEPVLSATVLNRAADLQAMRRLLGDLMAARVDGPGERSPHADKLANAVAELLENAQKYSPEGTAITLRLWASPQRLRFVVENLPATPVEAALAAVHQEIQRVWAVKNAREAFRRTVLSSMAEPGSKAMLGYAKIRLETGARLGARRTARGRLRIEASFPRRGPRRAVR